MYKIRTKERCLPSSCDRVVEQLKWLHETDTTELHWSVFHSSFFILPYQWFSNLWILDTRHWNNWDFYRCFYICALGTHNFCFRLSDFHFKIMSSLQVQSSQRQGYLSSYSAFLLLLAALHRTMVSYLFFLVSLLLYEAVALALKE